METKISIWGASTRRRLKQKRMADRSIRIFRRTLRCPLQRCVAWWVRHIDYIFAGVSRGAGLERARGHRRHRGSDAAPDGSRLDKGSTPLISASSRRTGTNCHVTPTLYCAW